jgi:hypothetical protein
VDRELALAALILATVGPALVAGAAWPWRVPRSATARRWEHVCWRTIWMPLLLGAFVFAALLGWAAIEPENAERLPTSVLLVSGLFAVVWLRAAARAAWALRQRPFHVPAGTLGFWRPQVVLSNELIAQLDSRALAAVGAHEAGHVHHRDPLRIWLAQFAIDLQWPWPGAWRRFEEWRRVLELARDEEARVGGTDGADLAAAVLTAARLGTARPNIAGLIEPGINLQDRIGRLLAPLPVDQPSTLHTGGLALVPLCVFALAALSGARFGEALVQLVVKSLP